jgi:hypothetical protein
MKVKMRLPAWPLGSQAILPGTVKLSGFYYFQPHFKVARLYAGPKGEVQLMAVASEFGKFFYAAAQNARHSASPPSMQG